ncbi:mitochondrial ribosome-associated GTPase 2 [Neosynchiropus ocellatus]
MFVVKCSRSLFVNPVAGQMFQRLKGEYVSFLVGDCLSSHAGRVNVSDPVKRFCTSVSLGSKARGTHKEQLSEKKLTRHFVDHRRVKFVAGSGGKGASCFHSEPRKEWGGPDGGNGGDGGSVIIKGEFKMTSCRDRRSDSGLLKACRVVKSLAQIVPVYKGEDGEPGGSKNCYGRNGSPTYISVPVGTVVKEEGRTVVDLSEHGQEYVAVFGGGGGKGNRFFLSNENRAPVMSTPGEAGQERVLHLELRTMAHAGLVGFPNAGKSSLLRAISNARPAVAAYPFTTLNPHVGIVQYRDHEQVAVADVPGIIQGAHLNRGLGIAFLRHIERCRFLLFVLDLSAPEPWTHLDQLRYELDQYEPGLSQRPQAIVANKMDLPEARDNLQRLRSRVTHKVIPVSALTGQNTEELILHLRQLYDGYVLGEGGGDKVVKCDSNTDDKVKVQLTQLKGNHASSRSCWLMLVGFLDIFWTIFAVS